MHLELWLFQYHGKPQLHFPNPLILDCHTTKKKEMKQKNESHELSGSSMHQFLHESCQLSFGVQEMSAFPSGL